ncbi:hypothetical protein Z957_05200 [Clostridium sp. K25]|uniref:HK97 family phage prohead protease n=1 Tax=Clostridium sp. K25 TaxID=1443109 RepID=UPI0004D9B91E|nr:HK97 family phage prohead protease [Clostridium sp. K25]KEI09300.1 hypothetical protein Z957_05200 [Clostridium sp. K25]
MEKNRGLVREERRILPCNIEFRSLENGEEILEGYVVQFNKRSEVMQDYWGDKFVEKVSPGAFTRALKENTIKALWNHQTSQVLGSTKSGTLTLFEDTVGLRFELKPSNTTWGNDAKECIRRGDVDGVSFGFDIYQDGDMWEWKEEEKLYIRTLLNINLLEISPTPFPAYSDSEVGLSTRSLEQFKDKNFNNDKIEKLVLRTYLGGIK